MFTHFIFLLILLVLSSFGGKQADISTFLWALAGYLVLLGYIVFQNKLFKRQLRHNKDNVLFLVNIELLAYLTIFYLMVGIPKVPYFSTTFSVVLALTLYFTGLYTFHYTSFAKEAPSRRQYAIRQTRLLIPFVLPILLYNLLSDTLAYFGFSLEQLSIPLVILCSALLALLLLLFLPPVLIRLWKCEPLDQPELLERLESLCAKAHFRHGGMKLWTILDHVPTAAIIGILPRFRYILFTRRLLHTSSPESIEAILAHEIGHSAHHHLLKFPLILLGMAVAATLFLSFFEMGISQAFGEISLVVLFIPLAILIALYIRYIFGYFSRLFERQADLYGATLGIPIDNTIKALDGVAIAAGNTHDVPSWHHYSIAQRIAYLERVKKDPSLIKKHHRKTIVSLILFFLFLLGSILVLVSPEFPTTPPFDKINRWGASVERRITDMLMNPLRHTAGASYSIDHKMEKRSE